VASTASTSTTTVSANVVGSGLSPPKRRRVPIRIIGEQDDEENRKGKGKEQRKEAAINVIGASTSSSSSMTSGKAKADNLVPNSKKHDEEDNDNGFLKPVSSRSILSSLTSPATLIAASTSAPAKTGLGSGGNKKEEDENKTKIMPKKDEGNLESIDEKKITEEFESELMRSLSTTSTSTGGAKFEPKLKPTPGLKYTSSPSTSVPEASTKDSATTTTTADKASFKTKDSFQKAKQARDASKPSRVGGGIFRASGESVIFRESSGSETKDAKEKGKVHEDEGNFRASPAPTLAQAASDIPSPATFASSPIPTRVPAPLKPPVAPQTLFEFSRMWDNALSSSKGKGKEKVVWDRWGLVCVSSFEKFFFSPLLSYIVLFLLSLLLSSPGPTLIENEDFD